MKIPFYKYHGTGNDFIIIDNRKMIFPKEDQKWIERICTRRFGIGADGLMLVENSDISNFKMIYYNADGRIGSMCGNGGRCIVAFAHSLGIFNTKTTFEAIGELYEAEIKNGLVSLKMNDVKEINTNPDHYFLNTGSPHHVTFEKDVDRLDVYQQGKK